MKCEQFFQKVIYAIGFNQFLHVIIHKYLYTGYVIQVYFTLIFVTWHIAIFKIRMDIWWIVLANLKQLFRKNRIERRGWFKKSKGVEKCKKIMIKKHQKLLIYVSCLKELLKKTFEATKENPNIEVNLWLLMIKLLTLNHWCNHMEQLITAVKIFLSTCLR